MEKTDCNYAIYLTYFLNPVPGTVFVIGDPVKKEIVIVPETWELTVQP